MGRRGLLLLLSFLIAAAGTGLVFAYVSKVDDRALKDQNPVTVLVVKKAIPEGTSVATAQSTGSFDTKEIAGAAVAPGALSDLTPIRSLVALAPLFPGEQVLQAKFGVAGSSSALAIPAGKLAVSVQLTDPARVAGFVTPGSEVAIFITTGAVPKTSTLLARVTVLAAGPTTVAPTNNTNTEALPRAILTLALSQLEAQKVIFASQSGQLYFGLLDAASKTSVGGGVNSANLFS
ncbi:MAG: hypothetical protein JWN31_1422 [Frankiales bacterium]|nr:hypothetical protein [Frankiales bacterium]